MAGLETRSTSVVSGFEKTRLQANLIAQLRDRLVRLANPG
jgi:hypothetical protein